MTSAQLSSPARAKPFQRLFVWPAGTGLFALRTWLALSLALYAAFVMELQSASSAGVCVMLLAQPIQGMVLSKAIYRTLGTLIGVTAAVSITSLFPQDRTMILAAFTLWMGLCTAVATVLRDFRAYGTVLAGYSVAIISITNIDAPAATFEAAIDRVAAILVGIVAIALVNSLLMSAEASRSMLFKLRAATSDVIAMARQALETRAAPDSQDCIAMSLRLMPLRSEISFATPELPDGRRRAQGARSALLGLFEMLTAIQAIGAGLASVAAPSPFIDEALAILQRALRLQRPERAKPDLDALTQPRIAAGTLSIEEAYVLDRLRFMIDVLGDIRDGMLSVRTGRAPRRIVTVPVHQDYLSVLLNFTRVIVSVGIVCALGVWSGQAETAEAVLFTAVYVSLGSISPNPSAMGFSAIFGLPFTVFIGAIYMFGLLPAIDGFPLFVIALAPIVTLTCYFMTSGQQGLGAVFGTMMLVLIAPANPQTVDPSSFVTNAVMFVLSGVIIFVSFRIVLPVRPEQRRLRLALAVGTHLRKALADEGRLAQPRASLQYDRLTQFKQWLGMGPLTLARRKMMMRMNDLGNLAFAVRRCWRALDDAAPLTPDGLTARARAILPTLSPDETLALAREYLVAAIGKEPAAGLTLTHAAAALFGTAFVTNKEARLLRRVELLRRVL